MLPSFQRNSCALVILLALVLSGCTALGPRTVPADRFDYNEAIADSSRQQMLLNLVRMQYWDFPSFLAVSSVITSYTYEGGAGISGDTGFNDPNADKLSANANIHYTERPTITYTPISGHEFIRRMLVPIPVRTLFAMAQSGWTVDLLLLTAIHRINDVENLSFATIPPPGEIELNSQRRRDLENAGRFQRVIHLLLTLEDEGVIEFQEQTDKKSRLPAMVISRHLNAKQRKQVREFRALLKLDPRYDVFRVTTRMTRRKPDEITIQSRSLLAIMAFISKGVDTPLEHQKKGWSANEPILNKKGRRIIPFHVRVARKRPEDAYLAVKYKGYWFYIDPRDRQSKRLFNYLLALFQLQAPAPDSSAPVVTLPAG